MSDTSAAAHNIENSLHVLVAWSGAMRPTRSGGVTRPPTMARACCNPISSAVSTPRASSLQEVTGERHSECLILSEGKSMRACLRAGLGFNSREQAGCKPQPKQ